MIYRGNILLNNEGQSTNALQHRGEHLQPVLQNNISRDMLLLQINPQGSTCGQEIVQYQKRGYPTEMGRSPERYRAYIAEDYDRGGNRFNED